MFCKFEDIKIFRSKVTLVQFINSYYKMKEWFTTKTSNSYHMTFEKEIKDFLSMYNDRERIGVLLNWFLCI